jgi:CheY-like chemotaxis protein
MTILVVEDEYLILDFICAEMEDAGTPAVGATSAEEAIRILQSREDITGLVTDINMPGSMDGLALAALVAERWPDVGIVITSGRRAPLAHEMPADSQFVPKPFIPRQIIDAMERITRRKGIRQSMTVHSNL